MLIIAIEIAVWLAGLLILVKLGILNSARSRFQRPLMLMICLVVSAVLTTPDVITQLLMAGLLYLIFEASIRLAKKWDGQKRNHPLQP